MARKSIEAVSISRPDEKFARTPALSIALSLLLSLYAPFVSAAAPAAPEFPPKSASTFYPRELIARARENARQHEWAAAIQKPIVEAAQPWMKLSDEYLWNLMFGNTIKRSWMVWSNGFCPACRKDVPMYNWIMAPLEHPWKTRCPHCSELFPKNDFEAFYKSGLDEHGVFDPQRADRKLLFNAEHPDPADPLRQFGVDDGEGYVDASDAKAPKRWRFIGAYLIYGQWKKGIVAGITNLAAAYAVTGEQAYAHKAGVLLDRVADLYPTFDFGKEGVMYEGPPRSGYVSTWHDACWEVQQLVIAYDQVFDGLKDDAALVSFLAEKAKRFSPESTKTSITDVRRNIEERIFVDTLHNRPKIESNYPMTDNAITLIRSVLGWPGNRAEVMGLLEAIIRKATAVDGLTGEKGLDGYARIAPNTVAETLGRYTRVDDAFLKEMLARHPRLCDMFRFHIDTWCLERYYPRIGDTGSFARPNTRYAGVTLSENPGLEPSGFSFLWQLYELTHDADFARVLYKANGNKTDGLPYDLFAASQRDLQKRVGEVIAREGETLNVSDVNKQQWNLAILRSGKGDDARAIWLDYDSGERHGHADAMNLGLLAFGLDLMPDFGYPPVHYGGWGAPRSVWYTISAAHNTVVIDGKNSVSGAGKTTLWASGDAFRAVRASAPALVGAQQFERTAALINVNERQSYVIDLFRVVGGIEHTKYMCSGFGEIHPEELSLSSVEGEGAGLQMRNFRIDRKPAPVWNVDWTIKDEFKLLPIGSNVHLRYTDLTPGAEVLTGEAWVSMGFTGSDDAWVPRVLVRRRAQNAPQASTFVSVIEPYAGKSAIASVTRLPLQVETSPCTEGTVGLQIVLADGRRDVLVAADVENPLKTEPAWAPGRVILQGEARLRFDGQMCWLRIDANRHVSRIALCNASALDLGDVHIVLARDAGYVELTFADGGVQLAAGKAEHVQKVEVNGKVVSVEAK